MRVLIVDDHAAVRCSLTRMLQDKPGLEVVGEASDGDAAIRLAKQVEPDVILMDVGMPGINGVDATRQIVQDAPRIRVIGLSVHDSIAYATRMFNAGASAYLLKDCSPEELIHEIRWGRPAPRRPDGPARSRGRISAGVR